jgi:hypothetical protein
MGQKTQFVEIGGLGCVGADQRVCPAEVEGEHIGSPLQRESHDQTGHPTEIIRARKKAQVVAIPPSR